MKVFWLAALAAVLWGSAPMFDKLALGKATPLATLTVRTIVVVVFLAVFVAASGGWRELHGLDARSIFYIMLGALAAGLAGQLVYYHALKLDEAVRVVPITATYPLVAALLAIVLLKEPITPGKIVGTVLIVLGVLAIRLDSMVWPR